MLSSIVSPLDGFRSPFGPQRGFNPARLFSGTDTGWIYDLYDMSTLFQDAAGTTPVTAVGQPVGLCLDKSKGLVLGPELVTNGGFDTDTDWTKGTGWTISSGVATTASGGTGTIDQSVSLVAGRAYRIDYTITGWASGQAQIGFSGGTTVLGPLSGTGNGARSIILFAVTGNNLLRVFKNTSSDAFSIDNISVRELPGNHRSQSASLPRPTYARHPLGGIRNLLTFTEQFDNAAWVKSGTGVALAPVVTANAGLAPDGTMTADRVQFNCVDISAAGNRSSVTQIVSNVTLGLAYASSIYIRAFDAGNIGATVRIASDGVNNTVYTLTGDWQRVPISGNSIVTSSNLIIETRGTFTGQTADVLIWGAQFEPGSAATAYQRVVSVFDVTEAGVPDLYYLSYDGLNDSLSTAPFAWGSNKATVVAGVRKLTDGIGTVAEMSVAADGNSGAFFLRAPTGNLPNYQFLSRGTSNSSTAPSPYAAPITHVLSCLADISGDTNIFRVNGIQVASNLADQGTGNYGTYPVFFGARAGTSLFFNGREYSQFAINRLLTANELAQIERYTAQRTGVTL